MQVKYREIGIIFEMYDNYYYTGNKPLPTPTKLILLELWLCILY